MYLIGDPHLGRVFKANVPLDRRGEREQMMMDDFQMQLWGAEDDLIVIVGDLFDHWYVSWDCLVDTIHIILTWQTLNPTKTLVIMQGNHDYSPNKGQQGAFDALEASMYAYDNIHVVRAVKTVCGVIFFPWQWERNALEQLDDVMEWTDTAVGHWDLEHFGGDTSHLCPAKALQAKGVLRIFSGHWHLAGDYDIEDVTVTCTGSMQPMTHAEDPDGKLYITLTEEEYLRTSSSDLRDKYVRVILRDGGTIESPETCLGFKIKKAEEIKAEQERVTLGDFNIHKILDESFKKHEVPEPIQMKIKGNLNDIA